MTDPQDILDALAGRPADTVRRLRATEDGALLVAALREATTDDARQLLCDVLGFRHERGAVDVLVEHLTSASSGVRSSAADALAKIGDRQAGPALLAQLIAPEPDPGAFRMIVVALGAVGHRESISVLVPMLDSSNPSLRGSAAWSLGALAASEALQALSEALRRETNQYPTARMREAIAALQSEPAGSDPTASSQ